MNHKPIITLSPRMGKLPPYLFGTLNTLKMKRRRQGVDVIDLGMGNPTDPTPETITEKLCEVAYDPKSHRYPVADGMNHLKKELTKMYMKDYMVSLSPEDNVMMTIGSKEGISHLLLALIGSGDRVCVPAPYFPVHVFSSVISGGDVHTLPFHSEQDFLDRLAHLCNHGGRPLKLLILNYPHNPTGRLVTRNFFQSVVGLANTHGFMVIHDFAYSKITFDGIKAISFLETPGALDVGVEFGSFSKTYNMAGWRLGYCTGNSQMIEALKKIKGYFDYGIFSAIQVAGIIALRYCDGDIQKQIDIYQERRDLLCEGLNQMGWDTEKPGGGMFVWTRIPEYFKSKKNLDTMGVAMELLDKANVVVSPGSAFGKEGEGYLRVAMVENKQRLRQALRQMKNVI